jgi:sulfopyruvate decarboxylase subunit beta
MSGEGRMSARGALVALHRARGERDIVITTMTPARDWMTLTQSPLDIILVPSAMGHATSLGLGLALAQPDRRVVVCNGDGSMLMNLGSLVSITGTGVSNLIVLVFDNGVYEVTGAQPTPASSGVDFAAIARGAGFQSVFEFATLDEWERAVERILNAVGPAFVLLEVEPVTGLPGPRSPGPTTERARRFVDALSNPAV